MSAPSSIDEPPSAQPTAASLPSAWEVVSRGLQLAGSGSAELRRASVYFGLIFAATAGPFILAAIFASVKDAASVGEDAGLAVLVFIAVLGLADVGIESTGVASAILGGRAAAKPLTLKRAVTRTRDVFWRLATAWLAIAIATALIRSLVIRILPAIDDLTPALIAVVVTAPLGYAQAGVVLGGVGASTALRRSVGLTRARPSYAVAIALFSVAATFIQVFALDAGVEVVVRVADAVGLDPSTSTGLLALLLGASVGSVALGSLIFTIIAIQAAPQVVAFLVLTGYSAGLDDSAAVAAEPARSHGDPSEAADTPLDVLDASASGPLTAHSAWAEETPRPTTFHWLTRPMYAVIGVAIVLLIASGSRYV